jgi:hypothetical protein
MTVQLSHTAEFLEPGIAWFAACTLIAGIAKPSEE